MTVSSGMGARLGYLDSLRCLAAALVLLQHLAEGQPGSVGNLVAVAEPGVAGVAMFFFISGHAIGLSASPRLRVLPFLTRRLARIYPLYLVALAILVLTGGWLPKWTFMATAPALAWVANLALVQDFTAQRAFLGVSWTLIIELFWYLLFAIAVRRFGDRAGPVLDTVVPLGVLAATLASLLLGVRIPLGRPLMIYAAVIGFQCMRHARGEISAAGLVRSLAIFAVVAGAALLVGFGVFSHAALGLMQVLGPWLLASAVFLTVVLLPGLRWSPWLNRGVLPAIGLASYSIYLLHPIAIEAASVYLPVARLPAALALTALLALIGYRCIERPAITAGRRLAGRFGAPVALVAG